MMKYFDKLKLALNPWYIKVNDFLCRFLHLIKGHLGPVNNLPSKIGVFGWLDVVRGCSIKGQQVLIGARSPCPERLKSSNPTLLPEKQYEHQITFYPDSTKFEKKNFEIFFWQKGQKCGNDAGRGLAPDFCPRGLRDSREYTERSL